VTDPTVPAPGAPSALELTGERTLPGIPDETYWFERHVVAYELATALVRTQRPRVVLDAGCGEGYGLRMLAEAGAPRVVGVDLEEPVVAHVRATYAAHDPRIEVHTAELMQLPLADDEVELTVSFQVIEHLHDIPGYLRSLRRVTRPGGQVVIATPNRLTFTPGSDVPVNPFHTREFTAAELRDELTASGLQVMELLGVHHGPELRRVEADAGRSFTDLLVEQPPVAWPGWLRDLVHRVDASWFHTSGDDLDASLDLVAVCCVPSSEG
jgi:SAM-dependent methyltransferase